MIDPAHKRDIRYSSDDGHPWEEESKTGPEAYLATKVEKKVNIPGEFVYAKPLKWYFDVLTWPMFILLLAEVGIRVMQTRYMVNIAPEIFEYVISLARVFLLAYLAVLAIKQYQADKKQALAVTAFGGILVGLVLAVFQLFWYFELWTFFNLLGQPLLLGAEGLVIAWLATFIFKKKLSIN